MAGSIDSDRPGYPVGQDEEIAVSLEARHGRGNFRFPLFALIVIIVGVILLLQTLGLLSWALWSYLWRFWPVLIIIIGINLILGRRSPWIAAAVSLVLIFLAVGVAAWQAGLGHNELVSGHFSQPLDSIRSATLDMTFGAGELTLESLPGASVELMAGETRGPEGAKMSLQLSRFDGQASVKLAFPQEGWPEIGANPSLRWDVNLSPRLLLDLNLTTGASTCLLDLSELRVGKLDLRAGASRIEAIMPRAAGQTDASISAGAADIVITIPEGVAARVKHTGISALDINEQRFPKVGDYYVSPNYNTAANRVNIDLNTGAASVRVR